MIIICSNCNTKYSICKRVLGNNGKKVKCFNCKHEWYQKIDITKRKGVEIISLKEKPILSNVHKEEIDVKAFTYPGPKPYSKETAILMMADSSEASARSLKNPTAEHIDALIERVINKQLREDQFVNADITLKEITQLKKLFKKKLVNIHHARVEY